MSSFDRDQWNRACQALQMTMDLEKKGFVPMPGGSGEPVMGASPATAALTNPMGGPQQGDPSMQATDASGMPIDPSTGMPLDPAAMGGAPAGMPPPGADPSAGMAPPPPSPDQSGDGLVSLPFSQLMQLMEFARGGSEKSSGKAAGKTQAQGNDVQSQISAIYQAMSNAGMIPPTNQPGQ